MTTQTLEDLIHALQAVGLTELASVHASVEALKQPVSSVVSDSRQVKPGSVFVALAGEHTDGHAFLPQAIQAGAVALVVDAKRLKSVLESLQRLSASSLSIVLPAVLAVANPYQALAQAASWLNGYPGKRLRMVGVTGTNGKTTVTHLIERILKDAQHKDAAQHPVGLIGTLGHRAGYQTEPPESHPEKHLGNNPVQPQAYTSLNNTTPMAPELQRILSDFYTRKTKFVVMEVSSHALEQHRTEGCDFEVAVFTNLTQDHLDYHQTMAQYCQAKLKLFSGLQPAPDKTPRSAVINADSPYADRFIAACPEGTQLLTYAIDNPAAAIRAENLTFGITGAAFTVVTPAGQMAVKLKISGKFSIYNALAALGAGLALQVPLERCVASLQQVEGVRGRFEVVSEKPYVIVDYAHTPDGLENILSAARLVTPENGKLIVVFGCGGDRDATKRPKMGRIAERLADRLVITSDNPRSEDPQQIITDILSGIERFDATRMLVCADRQQAIHQAIDSAQADDIIVVAGKGHEDYQILKDRTIHFDDREVVQRYVSQKQTDSQADPQAAHV